MKTDCSKGHLFGPTLDCIMCGEPKLCERCNKKHSRSGSMRREAIRFLTQTRELRGLGAIAMRRERLVDTILWMIEFMIKGGPEVPPTKEEIACYVEEFIEYAKPNTGATRSDDQPSAS